MKEYTILPGQSLFDIAVVVYGDVSGVAWLLADNPSLAGPTDRLQPGKKLSVRPVLINARTRNYLQDYPTIATIDATDQPEGVGYWRLNEYQVQ